MAPPPRRSRRRAVSWILGTPTAMGAAAFTAASADNMLGAAIMGALVGLAVGIGILAFPNLDRGGPADHDDFLH